MLTIHCCPNGKKVHHDACNIFDISTHPLAPWEPSVEPLRGTEGGAALAPGVLPEAHLSTFGSSPTTWKCVLSPLALP